jgi:hypothetical protein
MYVRAIDPVDGGIGSINPVYHLESFITAFVLFNFSCMFMCDWDGYIPDLGNKQAYLKGKVILEEAHGYCEGD